MFLLWKHSEELRKMGFSDLVNRDEDWYAHHIALSTIRGRGSC